VVKRTLARIASGLALGALLLSTRGALADERTEARAHFKKGMAAISEGRYDVGIEELKSAYDILPHPNVLYNIARAYVDIGDLDDAVVYYRRYLDGAPEDRDEVARLVAGLEERTRKQQAMLLESQQAAAAPAAPPGGQAPAAANGPATAPPAAIATETSTAAKPAAGDLKTEQVFEETVVTASRSAQSPLDAPSSTSIITEQDIRLSGITKIPELLRRLAGVDIMETTGSQTEVSIRGFNQRLSSRVLVLIDGRSVYVDLVGATFWGELPVGVEDIARIEVVRGPGSALYGADAFNGVINIITKAPGEGDSGVNAGYGDHNAAHGTLWASGRDGDLGYRISAGYDYEPRWSREVPQGAPEALLSTPDQTLSGRTVRFNAAVTRQLGKDVQLRLDGSYVESTNEILGVGAVNDQLLTAVTPSLTASLKSKNFEARVFWNYYHGDEASNAAYVGQSLLPALYNLHVVDAEAQYIGKFATGRGIDHDLHIGVEYRLKALSWTYDLQDETENHVGIFAHDEIKLGTRFAIVGDYRADYVPYLARIVQSPRGSVLFHPSRQSTVRALVATAFRTPNFLESYIGLPVTLPLNGAELLARSQRPDQPNFRLKPEQIFTTEVGYLNSESDYFTFDSALFYNHANNLIDLAPSRPVTVANLANPNVPTGLDESTGAYPIFFSNFENQCQRYNVYGAELGVRAFPIEGLDLYGNYTFMDVRQDNSGCTQEQVNLLAYDARTSMHKFNAGVQLRTKFGVDAEIDVHYVSPQDWSEQVTDVQKQQIVSQSSHLDAYTLVNAKLGYRFLKNHAEISGVAFNLLDDQHREHPYGQIVARRLMGFGTYRF
jgi:outer membrane receptor for ferrienterochelin and colicin